MLIYCVRHGESSYNAEGRIQGQRDVPLSKLGEQQAVAVADALRAAGIEAIYSSPLARSMETARRTAEAVELEIATDRRLMEINAGILEGMLWTEILTSHRVAAEQWIAQEPDFVLPGGESRRALAARGVEVLEEIARGTFERVAVFSHGGLLTAAIKTLIGVPAERNPFTLANGSISRLKMGERVRLETLNVTAHVDGIDSLFLGDGSDVVV